MKQAIAEGYILDVLDWLPLFKLAFQIGQTAGGETEVVSRRPAKRSCGG